jgi:hypothetical protein
MAFARLGRSLVSRGRCAAGLTAAWGNEPVVAAPSQASEDLAWALTAAAPALGADFAADSTAQRLGQGEFRMASALDDEDEDEDDEDFDEDEDDDLDDEEDEDDLDEDDEDFDAEDDLDDDDLDDEEDDEEEEDEE